MGYCVIERGANDSLRFVVQGVFPTREAARDALSAALADGSVSLSGDVRVADLDAAAPVLVVHLAASEIEGVEQLLAVPDIGQPEEPLAAPEIDQPEEPSAAPETEPAAEPLVAEAESPAYVEFDVADAPPTVEYVAAESVVTAPVSAGWDSAALDIQEAPQASLADALRRATLSLEEEGIVAPASIESAVAGAVADIEWPDVTADPLAPAAGWAEAGAVAPHHDIDFAVSGDLQLESYTCDDCVYSNTCPKVGKTAPAECGAFQWRSE